MELKELQERIDKALNIALQYGQIDGAHHKAWVIDQIVRVLAGDDYKKIINEYVFDGKEPVLAVIEGKFYQWDIGVAP